MHFKQRRTSLQTRSRDWIDTCKLYPDYPRFDFWWTGLPRLWLPCRRSVVHRFQGLLLEWPMHNSVLQHLPDFSNCVPDVREIVKSGIASATCLWKQQTPFPVSAWNPEFGIVSAYWTPGRLKHAFWSVEDMNKKRNVDLCGTSWFIQMIHLLHKKTCQSSFGSQKIDQEMQANQDIYKSSSFPFSCCGDPPRKRFPKWQSGVGIRNDHGLKMS